MKKSLLCLAGILFLLTGWGQINFNLPTNRSPASITAAEYFFDSDPGFGNGTAIAATPSTDITQSFTANIASLIAGVHRLYSRVRDADGSWSLTNVQPFGILKNVSLPSNPSATSITKAEYFIDTDPGFGNGTNIPLSSSTDVTIAYTPDISSLSVGSHQLYVRVKDNNGSWSHTNMQPLFIFTAITIPVSASQANITSGEYFFDTDPGFGNGTQLSIVTGADVTASNVAVSLSGLSTGVHRLYVRVKDANGSWGHTNFKTVSIVVANISLPPNPSPTNMTKLEYFFDTDPGFGNGYSVTIPAGTDLSNFSFAADLTGLSNGPHQLYVRVLDDWSLTNVAAFMLGTPLPVTWLSFSAKEKTDSVLLNWQTSAEMNNVKFTVERSADAVHFNSIGTVHGANTSLTVHSYNFTDHSPVRGTSFYRIKQTDANGQFSYSATMSVHIANGKLMILTNPVHSDLYVQLPNTRDAVLTIYSADGKVILQNNISVSQNIQHVDVSAMASGNYFLQYQSGNEKQLLKFIKQ